jgi:hypothetical protein
MKIEVSQYEMKSFQTTICNHVVMGCKLFLFRHQVALRLRSTRWNGLIGHPKDRGKDDLNSMAEKFEKTIILIMHVCFSFPSSIRFGFFPFLLGFVFLF